MTTSLFFSSSSSHQWWCMRLLVWLLLCLLLIVVVAPRAVFGQEQEEKSLTQVLEEHRNELSLYISAIEGIGLLKGDFSGNSNNNGNNNRNTEQQTQYTVFAPSDTAIRNDPHFFLYINGASKQPPTWHLHLRAAVLHHIVQGQAYTTDELFSTNTTNSSKISMQNEVIHVNADKQTLGLTGAKLHDTLVNIRAKNGILHVVNQVFPVELTKRSIADLEDQAEFRSIAHTPAVQENSNTSLIDVVDFVGPRGRDILNITLTTGLTHVGCSRQAFSDIGTMITIDISDDAGTTTPQQEYLMHTINDSPNGVRLGELLNATRKDETLAQFVDYSLLPKCFYRTDLPNDFEQLVMPVGECAHMWVTKREGRVCFNAACQVDNPKYNGTGNNGDTGNGNQGQEVDSVVGPVGHDEPPFREFIARNGYGYVVDQCLMCAGMFTLVDIGARYTSTPIQQSAQFFHRVAEREGWNLRHVTRSVLQQAAREYPNNNNANDDVFANVKYITILSPTERAWEKLNFRGSLSKYDETFRGRLRDDDAWYLHLKHLLFHCIIPQVYLVDELIQMAQSSTEMGGGDPFTITSLAGEEIRIRYDDTRQELQIDDKDVFLADVKGIDGYMHFAESIPIPVALMNSVYTMARWDKDDRFRKQLNFVHHVGLYDHMQKRVPVTAFMVPNDLWPGEGEDDEILREIAANPDVLEEEAVDISIYELERTILLNHIFDIGGPWSCDDLRNMDGQVVQAGNGKNRVIVYNEEKDAPCLAVQLEGGGAPPEILACVVECNILARNGIFHVLDRPIFHVEDPPTAASSQVQPTASPAPSTGPPTFSPAPTAPSVAPTIDISPGNESDTGPGQPTASAQPTVSAQPTTTPAPTTTHAPTTTPAPTIAAQPTATAAPTITATPTTTASPTATAAPTITAAPTLTAAPTITSSPTTTATPSSIEKADPTEEGKDDLVRVTMTFYGIRIPIKGVPQLDEGGQRFFQDVTRDWYEMVYGQVVSSTRANSRGRQQPGRRNLQEAGIYNFTTRVKYTDQAVSHPWNTITYTQVVSYLQAKERLLVTDEEEDLAIESNEKKSSMLPTPRDVLLSPFYDDLLVKNYTDRLRQHPLFANITDSGNPSAPRSADENQANIGWGSRNYWNVYFILAYIGFGLAVASTFFLTVDLLLKLLLRPLPPLEEEGPPPSEAPLIQPSGTRIDFDKRPSNVRSLN